LIRRERLFIPDGYRAAGKVKRTTIALPLFSVGSPAICRTTAFIAQGCYDGDRLVACLIADLANPDEAT
jgi:hypothetical protein